MATEMYSTINQISDIPADRLVEICNAERDGRLVVLPCIREFDNGEYGTAYEVLWWECRYGFMTKSFKTRAEAEAALKGARGNEPVMER